jgi:hypothetical protein
VVLGVRRGRPVLELFHMKQNTVVRGNQLVAVGDASVEKALARVVACQGCTAVITRPFGLVLAETLGHSNMAIEYVMSEPAFCPNCSRPMFENTFVRCEGEQDDCRVEAIREYEPNWEETNVVLIDETLIAQAEACISGCEHCVANTETTFDYVLDAVTQLDPSFTEYVLCGPAKCPRCGHDVTEKTFVAD